MTPDNVRRHRRIHPLHLTNSPLGRMLIAATDKGICSIQFDSDEELERGQTRVPFRRLSDDAKRGQACCARCAAVNRMARCLSIFKPPLSRVWKYLQSIPFGNSLTARLRKRLASPRQPVPWPEPAPPTLLQWPFLVIAWSGEMATWQAIAGARNGKRLCGVWNENTRKPKFWTNPRSALVTDGRSFIVSRHSTVVQDTWAACLSPI